VAQRGQSRARGQQPRALHRGSLNQFLAGYSIIDVENPEQAFAIAARGSRGPGAAGMAL
jgi:hypothetical protein